MYIYMYIYGHIKKEFIKKFGGGGAEIGLVQKS